VRRLRSASLLALLALPVLAAPPRPAPPTAPWAALERRIGGRLGVCAVDTGSGRRLDHRSGERFPLCSTFKALLGGLVLARVDAGREALDQRITYTRADLVPPSPVTGAHVAEGAMAVGDLCAATIQESDNAAANLLLARLGGPPALTAYLRSLGDDTTRLDRTEPELNSALPGDLRDTTTPAAMAATLRTLLLGEALTPASRQRLEAWMRGAITGKAKLRAGLPADWLVGDKTGAGDLGTMNDVAILRPPGRAPILVAVYLTGSKASWADREAVIAEVGRIVARAFGA
jgi:beta-lactamase class A